MSAIEHELHSTVYGAQRAANPVSLEMEDIEEGERRSSTPPRAPINKRTPPAEQPVPQEQHNGTPTEKNTYEDPEDLIWSVYNRETARVDRALVDRWKGDMDGLLIFAGLFSAVITAFIIESYKSLKTDSGDTTVALLNQISLQLAAASNSSQFTFPSPAIVDSTFQATSSSVRVNLYWFLSLALSLATALAATLVQQWSRYYLQAVERREVPRIRARIRSFLFEGVEIFRMSAVVEVMPALLHVAVFIFLGGLVEFLHPLNSAICRTILGILAACGTLYAVISVLPSFIRQCPYRSPLTTGVWYLFQALRSLSREVTFSLGCWTPVVKGNSSLQVAQEKDAQIPTDKWRRREVEALKWTLESLTDHGELQPFIEGIPGYVKSEYIQMPGRDERIRQLFADTDIIKRTLDMLKSCQHDRHQSKTVERALAAIKVGFCFGRLTAHVPRDFDIRMQYESLFKGISRWCAGNDISTFVAHVARCAMMVAPTAAYNFATWSEWSSSYFTFSDEHWTLLHIPAHEEPREAIERLRKGDFHRDEVKQSSIAACLIIIHVDYLLAHPERSGWDSSQETLEILSKRMNPSINRWSSEVKRLYVSYCARIEGLDTETLLGSVAGEHLQVASWIKDAAFQLLRYTYEPEERRRAVKILEHAKYDRKDDGGPLYPLLQIEQPEWTVWYTIMEPSSTHDDSSRCPWFAYVWRRLMQPIYHFVCVRGRRVSHWLGLGGAFSGESV